MDATGLRTLLLSRAHEGTYGECFDYGKGYLLDGALLKEERSTSLRYSLIYEREVEMLVPRLCSILSNPMDHSPPGSSDHGILQARILEWVVISFSKHKRFSYKDISVSSLQSLSRV